MKQNSQWLSQVRIWSNRADCTSTPSGSPAALVTVTLRANPPRATSSSTSGSSVSRRYWMTSRGTWPPTVRNSSPGRRPARAAGDPSVTATTRGSDIAPGVYGFLRGSCLVDQRSGVGGELVGPELGVGGVVRLDLEPVVAQPPRRVQRAAETLGVGRVRAGQRGVDLGLDGRVRLLMAGGHLDADILDGDLHRGLLLAVGRRHVERSDDGALGEAGREDQRRRVGVELQRSGR